MRVYKLIKSVIGHKISRNSIGVYWLGRFSKGHFEITYIGRSDGCLKRRLLQHTELGKYGHFAFKITPTIFDAFRLECQEWHNRACVYNLIHPDSPRNLPYICPYCLTQKEFGNLLHGGM